MGDPTGRALERSGLTNLMSVLGGFRGPKDASFNGSVYPYAISVFKYVGAIMAHCHLASCYMTWVFMPDMSLKDKLFLVVPTITSSVSFFRIYYVGWNRRRIQKLLDMNEEASRDIYCEDELADEIKKWTYRARILQPILCLIISAPLAPWASAPIINEIFGNPWGPRRTVLISWFPYDIQKTHFWVLTVFIQLLSGFHATLINLMFDALFICISLRQVALLVHLRKSFSKIFQIIHVDKRGNCWFSNYNGEVVSRKEMDSELNQRLKYWIRKHQVVLRLLNELQSLFSTPLFLHFGFIGITLATGTAAVIKGAVTASEFYYFGLHVVGLSFNLFVLCRIGDLVKIETDEMAEDLCGQNYFLLSKSQHTLIKNVLTSVREPFIIKAVHALPLSTDTFSSVMKTTYSFYAMFAQMEHRN